MLRSTTSRPVSRPPATSRSKSSPSSPSFSRGRPGRVNNNPVDETIIRRMTQFRDKSHKEGRIDVYWLYDDGGLTLLLPHILSTRAKFSRCAWPNQYTRWWVVSGDGGQSLVHPPPCRCKLRVFFLSSSSSSSSEVEEEARVMAALLAKFRIEFQDVVLLADATRRPGRRTREEFRRLTQLPVAAARPVSRMQLLRGDSKSFSASSMESASSTEGGGGGGGVGGRNIISEEDLDRWVSVVSGCSPLPNVPN